MSDSNVPANPYQPPVRIDDQYSVRNFTRIAAVCFWVGTAFLTFGFLSVFIRNSPPMGWMILALLLLISAAWLGSRRTRRAAIAALLLCTMTMAASFLYLNHLRAEEQRMRARQALVRARANAIAKQMRAHVMPPAKPNTTPRTGPSN